MNSKLNRAFQSKPKSGVRFTLNIKYVYDDHCKNHPQAPFEYGQLKASFTKFFLFFHTNLRNMLAVSVFRFQLSEYTVSAL